RQKLRKAALALAEDGVEPAGNRAQDQKVRSVAVVLPAEQSFVDGIGEAMVARPGVRQTTV
ncbi:hypothetical protein AB0F91_46755, partial [Amycolatopsis sp. NPDC023774]|uniref:hypothetical protein n=1 Tax=Amycolatopsis sp. NPDC023774 TaxID=3155015 RepID=UPI0033D706B7